MAHSPLVPWLTREWLSQRNGHGATLPADPSDEPKRLQLITATGISADPGDALLWCEMTDGETWIDCCIPKQLVDDFNALTARSFAASSSTKCLFRTLSWRFVLARPLIPARSSPSKRGAGSASEQRKSPRICLRIERFERLAAGDGNTGESWPFRELRCGVEPTPQERERAMWVRKIEQGSASRDGLPVAGKVAFTADLTPDPSRRPTPSALTTKPAPAPAAAPAAPHAPVPSFDPSRPAYQPHPSWPADGTPVRVDWTAARKLLDAAAPAAVSKRGQGERRVEPAPPVAAASSAPLAGVITGGVPSQAVPVDWAAAPSLLDGAPAVGKKDQGEARGERPPLAPATGPSQAVKLERAGTQSLLSAAPATTRPDNVKPREKPAPVTAAKSAPLAGVPTAGGTRTQAVKRDWADVQSLPSDARAPQQTASSAPAGPTCPVLTTPATAVAIVQAQSQQRTKPSSLSLAATGSAPLPQHAADNAPPPGLSDEASQAAIAAKRREARARLLAAPLMPLVAAELGRAPAPSGTPGKKRAREPSPAPRVCADWRSAAVLLLERKRPPRSPAKRARAAPPPLPELSAAPSAPARQPSPSPSIFSQAEGSAVDPDGDTTMAPSSLPPSSPQPPDVATHPPTPHQPRARASPARVRLAASPSPSPSQPGPASPARQRSGRPVVPAAETSPHAKPPGATCSPIASQEKVHALEEVPMREKEPTSSEPRAELQPPTPLIPMEVWDFQAWLRSKGF